MNISISKIRNDFPFLSGKNPTVYLDNASTTQKPQSVIEALTDYYSGVTSNVGRGVYRAAEQTTEQYEAARATVARWIGAGATEVIFTSGATQGINLIATGWAAQHCSPGNEIVVSQLEHHSNLVPWQSVAKQTGAELKAIPVHSNGTLNLTHLETIITPRTRLVAVSHISNVTGALTNLELIIARAHAVGAKVLVDAAQSAPNVKLDVHKMDCDFLVFSGHKLLGPTGIGVLYIREDLQDEVTPTQLGGGMIESADFNTAVWREGLHRFEGGTPPIAQALGLAAAVTYLTQTIEFSDLMVHQSALCAEFIAGLQTIKGSRILGPVEELVKRGHLVSFSLEGIHAHDAAAYLDQYGIAVRAGFQCAYPLAQTLHWPPCVRVSFYLYNTHQEVRKCLEVLQSLGSSL
jgi:cysteine desulfurase / selenocysteine lyase